MTTFKPWEYRADAGFVEGTDLTGYTVVAVDGDIGHVEAEYDGRPAYLDVDVGSWLFGHQLMLPVGLVERIDATERKVYVDRTKDQIEHAPRPDQALTDHELIKLKILDTAGVDRHDATRDPWVIPIVRFGRVVSGRVHVIARHQRGKLDKRGRDDELLHQDGDDHEELRT